jgi:hypothetical protein
MAFEKRKGLPVHYSPKGTAKYPWLNKADSKFDADGVYKVDLLVAAADAEAMIAKIDEAITASLVAGKERWAGTTIKVKGRQVPFDVEGMEEADPPYFYEVDDNQEETGNVVFRLKVNAQGQNAKTGESWSNKPSLFDAAGNGCNNVQIFGGSTLKMSYQLSPWSNQLEGGKAGVTLRIKGAQIIKLAEKGAGGDGGFGKEEGFSAADHTGGFEDETPSHSNDAADGTSSPEDDF